MRYAILIEEGERNFSAYAPDVPGCIATGDTLEDIKRQMKEALEFHFEGMILHGEVVPEATTRCAYVDIKVDEIQKKVHRKKRTVG